MKVTVRDSEIFKNIEPSVLESHLRSLGWHEQGRIYNNAGAIWRMKNGSVDDEFEILLPLRTSLGDYTARIADAISTLEVVEKRSQLDILSDLVTQLFNVEIQGMVMAISESKPSGIVTLMGVVVGKLRRIKVELWPLEYSLAIKAYQEHLLVTCTGDLIKEGSFFMLNNLRYFALKDTETD